MTQQLRDVADCYRKFKIDYDGPPRMLAGELLEFRLKLLGEELVEYAAAHGVEVEVRIVRADATRKTIADAFDALLDMDYVLKGNAHLQGLDAYYHRGWERVHHANMAKELVSRENPGKRGSRFDIVKPPEWVAPQYFDLLP